MEKNGKQDGKGISKADLKRLAKLGKEIRKRNKAMLGRARLDVHEGIALGKALGAAHEIVVVKGESQFCTWPDWLKKNAHYGDQRADQYRALATFAANGKNAKRLLAAIKEGEVTNVTEAMEFARILRPLKERLQIQKRDIEDSQKLVPGQEEAKVVPTADGFLFTAKDYSAVKDAMEKERYEKAFYAGKKLLVQLA